MRMASAKRTVKDALKSSSTEVQLKALRRVGKSRPLNYGDDVLHLMRQTRNPYIKGQCAWVLGRLLYQVAYKYLVANLQDTASDVRIWSAWALGEIGMEQARIPLENAIDRESEYKVTRAIGGAIKKLNFESPRVHHRQVLQALMPPETHDKQIMSFVQELETLSFPDDKDKIFSLRSCIKNRNPDYLAQYINWVSRKSGLMAMLDDHKKVFK